MGRPVESNMAIKKDGVELMPSKWDGRAEELEGNGRCARRKLRFGKGGGMCDERRMDQLGLFVWHTSATTIWFFLRCSTLDPDVHVLGSLAVWSSWLDS
jgi:hypothetical protein